MNIQSQVPGQTHPAIFWLQRQMNMQLVDGSSVSQAYLDAEEREKHHLFAGGNMNQSNLSFWAMSHYYFYQTSLPSSTIFSRTCNYSQNYYTSS
jgi:hypothetical protein